MYPDPSAKLVARKAIEFLGSLNLLINNAGIPGWSKWWLNSHWFEIRIKSAYRRFGKAGDIMKRTWTAVLVAMMSFCGWQACLAQLSIGGAPPPGAGIPFGGGSSPIVQIGNDPTFGPICQGPRGVAPCSYIMAFEGIAKRIPVQQVGTDPWGNPVCTGELGNGPCQAIQGYILNKVLSGIQVQQVDVVPSVGPICAGPLGPGPCDAVRLYLVQIQLGLLTPPGPLNQIAGFDPRQGSLCSTQAGIIPCAMAQQQFLDNLGGPLPAQTSFGVPINQPAQDLAIACARKTGMNPVAFAGCTGRQIILTGEQQSILDCAVQSHTAPDFARCAAPHAGIKIPSSTNITVRCAMKADGDVDTFAECAGKSYANRALAKDEKAALSCVSEANGDPSDFAKCAGSYLVGAKATADQRKAILCAAQSEGDALAFAHCAGASSLSSDQRVVADCAMSSGGDKDEFLSCAASRYAGQNLSKDQQKALSCAAQSGGDFEGFAVCAGPALLGANQSADQKVALKCAAQSKGDATGFAVCAGANMFNLQLNPEQQIAVQCVVSTGGQPYAAAGCMASRLTARELTKCFTDGFGGSGCFGDSNDLVGKDGWVGRNLGQLAGGPNSVINYPNQIWGGDNSFVRNPGQIFGGNNSFVRNPSQFWGGNNSVFNNPSQLLPKPPPPVQVGKIGNTRICLPWC